MKKVLIGLLVLAMPVLVFAQSCVGDRCALESSGNTGSVVSFKPIPNDLKQAILNGDNISKFGVVVVFLSMPVCDGCVNFKNAIEKDKTLQGLMRDSKVVIYEWSNAHTSDWSQANFTFSCYPYVRIFKNGVDQSASVAGYSSSKFQEFMGYIRKLTK